MCRCNLICLKLPCLCCEIMECSCVVEYAPLVIFDSVIVCIRSSCYFYYRFLLSVCVSCVLIFSMLSEHVFCAVNTQYVSLQCCLENFLVGVKCLLEHGANINIQDNDLWTPLHVAAACGHKEIVHQLLEVRYTMSDQNYGMHKPLT